MENVLCWAAPADLLVTGFQASWKDSYNLTQHGQTLIYFADSSDTNLSMGIEISVEGIWALCNKNYEFLVKDWR